MVRPEAVADHERQLRTLLPGFKVWPPGARPVYSSIVVLEPDDWRNRRAIGYDMYSEAVRRRAMDEARDQNRAILSGKVTLVQEERTNWSPGFLLFLPYYRKDADLTSVEGRRRGLLGYVYLPFRTRELFRELFHRSKMILAVEVFEGSRPDPAALLYDTESRGAGPRTRRERRITLNGRQLLLRFSALPNFPRAASPVKTTLVYLTGTLATIFLWGFFSLLLRQMELARVMAENNQRLLDKEKEHVAARDEFLSIASHELKTPLTSLKLQAQVVLRNIRRNDPKVYEPEKVKALVKQIDDQTTRLTRLVDDMLDISRIRTGRLRIVKEDVELSEVVLDVVERLRPQFLRYNDDLPELDLTPGIRGNWDRFRLEQVLTNLFTNAMRYGNGRPVKVRTEVAGPVVRIAVIDQGIGIARENLEKIFERFERAGMSASEISGLGLGLFITNQIVRAHGGSIHVESAPGAGSTFIVELPF
jgi:signal transduction histidine kinase